MHKSDCRAKLYCNIYLLADSLILTAKNTLRLGTATTVLVRTRTPITYTHAHGVTRNAVEYNTGEE